CPVVGGGVDDGLGDATGAVGECLELEHTHGAVPEDGLGGTEHLGELLNGLRSDVQGEPPLRCGIQVGDLLLGLLGELGSPGEIDGEDDLVAETDRKSTRLNSSHVSISYAVFCLKKKKLEYIVE